MDNIAALKEAIGSQRIQKNAVLGVEMFLSASPDYFRPNAPEQAGTYDASRLEEWKAAPTLAKYLNEFRRGTERKKDTPPPPVKTTPAPKPDRPAPVSAGGFVITPDTPLDEL